MLFSEPMFLFLFLPCLLGLYAVVPRSWRNLVLLGASLFFYAYGEKLFVLLMLLSIGLNYSLGLALAAAATDRARTGWLAAGLTGDLGLLIAFKYANFIVDNFNALLGAAGLEPIELAPVHLPIGISFFTFQAMSYLIDIYRGTAEVQKNPTRVALYISLFPQLIAGPIVRYQDIARQLGRRVVTLSDFSYGVRRFTMGLGKKMIIANVLAYPADEIFALPNAEITMPLAWLAVFCYTLQIYFDFSGYSDMAIGLGRMFGFRILENFNYPYISRSITEFWRRWHISLSTWFRDYLYIPLGGNRVSPSRLYANLLSVFILCGLWHGASWNFLLWGLLHGFFLVFERVGFGRWLKGRGAVGHAYVLLVVAVSWVPFRAETLSQASVFLGAMVGLGPTGEPVRLVGQFMTPEILIALIIGVVGATPVLPALSRWGASLRQSAGVQLARSLASVTLLGSILFYSAMLMAAGSYNPFIYFRF